MKRISKIDTAHFSVLPLSKVSRILFSIYLDCSSPKRKGQKRNITKKGVLLSLIAILKLTILFSQTPDSTINRLVSQVNLYGEATNSPDLFLHIDKSIYLHNENIWFACYLLNDQTNLALHHTLYVLLIDPVNKRLLNSERFVIKNGFANGYMFLADSLAAGQYVLAAYTNEYINNPGQNFFKQAISLRSAQKMPFKMNLVQNEEPSPDSIRITYKVTTSYGGLASGADFRFKLFFENGELFQAGKKKINPFGEINFEFPKAILSNKLNLIADIYRKKDTQAINLPVMLRPNYVSIKFFPEGGSLVESHATRIAFEIVGYNGAAISTKGYLYEDSNQVASFQSNLYGQGYFYFIPHTGKKYSVKLDQVNDQFVVEQSFPEVLSNGYTIGVQRGIVNDTIRLEIYAPKSKSEFFVMVHNYRTAFYCHRISIASDMGILKIPSKNFPKGVITITLFDADGLPQAERSVFIPPKSIKVQFESDSAEYQKRSRVQMKVKLTDEDGNPIQAALSVATVFSKRFDSTRFKDIAAYQYFDKYRKDIETAIPYFAYQDSRSLENLLLIGFWTRYKLHETNLDSAIVSNRKVTNPVVGYVLHKDRKPKKPIQMMLFSKRSFAPISTDSTGYFELQPDMLIDSSDSQLLLNVIDNKDQKQHEYAIKLTENSENANEKLSSMPYSFAAVESDVLTAEEKESMKSMLKEVVVKAKNDDNYFAMSFIDKDCSAFVCACDHWMCPGCQPPRKPTLGRRYGNIIYMGCPGDELNPFIKKIKATYVSKEFYVADYEKYPPPLPELFTTLFWSGLVITDANGGANFSFFTNDLAGRFTCILQGLSAGGVISGKQNFKVVSSE